MSQVPDRLTLHSTSTPPHGMIPRAATRPLRWYFAIESLIKSNASSFPTVPLALRPVAREVKVQVSVLRISVSVEPTSHPKDFRKGCSRIFRSSWQSSTLAALLFVWSTKDEPPQLFTRL